MLIDSFVFVRKKSASFIFAKTVMIVTSSPFMSFYLLEVPTRASRRASISALDSSVRGIRMVSLSSETVRTSLDVQSGNLYLCERAFHHHDSVSVSIVGCLYAVRDLFVLEGLNVSEFCRDSVIFVVVFAEEQYDRLAGGNDCVFL